ncbi:MAG: hypothetical protein PHW04_16880 [Candidatus Wallbacteria bacterium]|nr:hypothetical protein [Candidatus Wallbacteria bacterium]
MKIIALLSLLCLISCASAEVDQAQALYQKAVELFRVGDMDKALESYLAALGKDKAILGMKDYGLSDYHISKLLKEGNSFKIGQGYFTYGKFDKAKEYLVMIKQESGAEYQQAASLLKQIEAIEQQQKDAKAQSADASSTDTSSTDSSSSQSDDSTNDSSQIAPSPLPDNNETNDKQDADKKEQSDALAKQQEAVKNAEADYNKWFALQQCGQAEATPSLVKYYQEIMEKEKKKYEQMQQENK